MACEDLRKEEEARYDQHQETLRAIREIHRQFTPTAGKIFTVPSPEWDRLMDLRLIEREQDTAYQAALDRLYECMRDHHAAQLDDEG